MRTETDKLESGFGVIRSDPFTYVAFFGGFVNCCGSKSRADIITGFERFREIIDPPSPSSSSTSLLAQGVRWQQQQQPESIPIIIDNITASGKLALDVRLTEIVRAASELGHHPEPDVAECNDPAVWFHRPHYPAIHIRYAKENRLGQSEIFGGGGLVTLYHTGSYTIVGVKNEDRLNLVYTRTVELLRQIHEMLGRTLL